MVAGDCASSVDATDVMESEKIEPRWSGGSVIIAGSGPSLTTEIADLCRNQRVIAVNDAYRLIPWAEILYACDARWWRVHEGCPKFAGEKWTSYHEGRRAHVADVAKRYKLHVCLGEKKDSFSLSPDRISYGRNSGFQAMNLAMLWGAAQIILVGFDFRLGKDNRLKPKRHFFGDHPRGLASTSNYPEWVKAMHNAAKQLPAHISVINCTPGSAIKCFPMGNLKEILDGTKINHAA